LHSSTSHNDYQDLYFAVSHALKDIIQQQWNQTKLLYQQQDAKQVYYLSLEFLLGRLLSNNIINLQLKETLQDILIDLNVDPNRFEDSEIDVGLGNGGLGRLAACYLESMATMRLPGHGACLLYKNGLFKQIIQNGYQVEIPDLWLDMAGLWLTRDPTTIVVKIENDEIGAIAYDLPIVGFISGYDNGNGSGNGNGNGTTNRVVNTLKLWDAVPLCQYCQNTEINPYAYITSTLYPPDNDYEGKKVRLTQEYFLVSATVQYIINQFLTTHHDLSLLPDKIQIHLNDTHPALTIAELMRILMDQHQFSWNDSWNLTQQICAYTNHTVMYEALEKWDQMMFQSLLPRIYQIVEEINRRFCRQLIDQHFDQSVINKLAIIGQNEVRMANLSILGSHSINGVSSLHTQILKDTIFKEFYHLFPTRFNNKTNGITPRRWLLKINPQLSDLITRLIGSQWITNLESLEQLVQFSDNPQIKERLRKIKLEHKYCLAQYIERTTGIIVNPNSIFDVQIKRLHEYKRQLLNALHILYLYNRIKQNPDFSMTPRTFIFAAKAAPGYHQAKMIIKLINSIADLVNKDSVVNHLLRVVYLENYGVSLAEKIIPATDIHEQISTASTEASGTSNMKFSLNGAIVVGTMDGANVEIVERVGLENEFIFGLSSQEVLDLRKDGRYHPSSVIDNDPELQQVLYQLINGTLNSNHDLFRGIYDSLVYHDYFLVLKDFRSYVQIHQEIDHTYQNQDKWTSMSWSNIIHSGYFSSDRAIMEYANHIWKIKPILF